MPARAVSTIQHCRRLGGSLRIAKLRGQRSGAAGGEQSKPTQRPLATCATAFISPCHPHPNPNPNPYRVDTSQLEPILGSKAAKNGGFRFQNESGRPPRDSIWNRKMAEDEMCPLDSPGPPPLKNGGGEEIMASLAVPVPFRVHGLGGPVVHLI